MASVLRPIETRPNHTLYVGLHTNIPRTLSKQTATRLLDSHVCYRDYPFKETENSNSPSAHDAHMWEAARARNRTRPARPKNDDPPGLK